ncbi:MAG TPA: GNAT family N-acetyltransferase [Armatimonadota bacterium]|jgi:CelD/BcsL family acetyltransferase involved in cellulose biosynthesis
MLSTEVIGRWDELLALGPEWEAMEDAGGAPTVFQTYAWQGAWVRHQRKGRCWSLTFRDGRKLVGLAPLFVSHPYRLPVTRLQLLSTGASDYLDLLALPERRAEVSEAFFGALRERRRGWGLVDLHQLREECELLPREHVEQQRHGGPWWRFHPQAVAPYTDLPQTREAFLEALGKKTRKNLGYSRRVLEREHSVELGLADEGCLVQEMEAFFRLHQARWNKRWMPGQMAGARTRAFHLEAARGLLRRGKLRLHYLRLDGATVASLYCFSHGGVGYYYLGGFDPALSRYGIGTLLTAEAMMCAIDEGCREFDFLRGQESYKYRWGCLERINYRLLGTYAGPGPRATERLANLEQRVADWYEARAHGGGHQAPPGSGPAPGAPEDGS